MKGVLAQRLFIEKVGLPSPLLDQLKRLAAFQNPEFYKKQRMRQTPRVVACAEATGRYKRLPTYRAIGYARGDAPLGFAEPPGDTAIEYDEEALRHFEEQDA